MLSSRADSYYIEIFLRHVVGSVDNHVKLPPANLRHFPSPAQSHGTSAISHVASRPKQPSSPTPADVFWRISIRYTVVAMFPLPTTKPSLLSALRPRGIDSNGRLAARKPQHRFLFLHCLALSPTRHGVVEDMPAAQSITRRVSHRPKTTSVRLV